jgi:archaellum biogenesis protein FlaJ (TadC family)
MSFKDHTQSDTEVYRKQMLATQAENELLRHNIKELQEQVYTLYKRIANLVDGDMERKTSDRD